MEVRRCTDLCGGCVKLMEEQVGTRWKAEGYVHKRKTNRERRDEN